MLYYYIQDCINCIQQCSIVQSCIPRKLEAFCKRDGRGRVISREMYNWTIRTLYMIVLRDYG